MRHRHRIQTRGIYLLVTTVGLHRGRIRESYRRVKSGSPPTNSLVTHHRGLGLRFWGSRGRTLSTRQSLQSCTISTVVTTKMGHQRFGANEYPGADADAVVQYKNSSEAGANPLISSALDARGAAPAPVATAELRRGETSCATAFRTRRAFPANLQVGKTGGPP